MSKPEWAHLGFGDVVQFGDADPETGDVAWHGLDVIRHGAEPGCVETFPVATDNEGQAYLDLPGTAWGTHVRYFGRLSLERVREILLPHADPAHRQIAMRVYTENTQAGSPPRQYNFLLQDCTTPGMTDTAPQENAPNEIVFKDEGARALSGILLTLHGLLEEG